MQGTFRPERIESIATRFEVDGKQALENILVGKALNSESESPLPVSLPLINAYVTISGFLCAVGLYVFTVLDINRL